MLVEINCRINPWNQLSDLAYLLQLIRINGLIHFVPKYLVTSLKFNPEKVILASR